MPQGSVLGPLLFLIYINDLAGEMLSTSSSITMYADDLLLHRVISSSDDYELLQNEINTLAKWFDRNNLTLNASKCKCMLDSEEDQYHFIPSNYICRRWKGCPSTNM